MDRTILDIKSAYKRFVGCLFSLLLILSLANCGGETEQETDSTEPVATEEMEEQEPEEWDYENPNWEEISDAECESNVQSPVNIDTSNVIAAHLADINYEYEPFPMKIVDNGHTVQVYGTENSYITVEDKRYQFKQFHFHNPSEHTINDNRYPMELHLVHQEEGMENLMVLAVFIEETALANDLLEKIFIEIPEEEELEVQTDVTLMLSDYIPPTQDHYTYIGSLTTPPCTVGVNWIIFKEPITASREQIERFSQLYANNARPIQPLNNRRVLDSAHE